MTGENENTQDFKKTLIGILLLLLMYWAVYPVWLLWTTYSTEETVLKEPVISQSLNDTLEARTNIVNIYRNNWFYNVCDQGCEVVNMYWYAYRLKNGKYRCEPVLDMYFSTYKPRTDTIAPGNRLVLYLANGDTIVKTADNWFFPRSIGSVRRYAECHAQRSSYYTSFSKKETGLLRSVPITSVMIESKNDTLAKNLSPASATRLRNRFIYITSAFSR